LHTVGGGLTPPTPLHPATAAVLLTLVDNETPLWLDPTALAARDWLAFHCGAAFAASPAGCSFALALSLPDLASLPAGGEETPEASATLILQVAALGSGAPLRLTGPGLQEPAVLAVDGLTGDFAACWAANRALYPRGVDLVLCAGTTLAALPRSVTVEEVR
jgi:alpha-D-ribose 1-methylphosphonate 5-triphosphate synthase subunit PhnH